MASKDKEALDRKKRKQNKKKNNVNAVYLFSDKFWAFVFRLKLTQYNINTQVQNLLGKNRDG